MPPTTPFPCLLLLLSLLHTSTSICLPRGSTTTPPPPPPPNPSASSTPTPFASSPPTPSASSPPTTPSIPSLLNFFCNHTAFSDICIKSLNNLLPASKSPTNSTVLAALISAVDAKTHIARSFAQDLSVNPDLDNKTRELLHDCIDTYDDALDNLESANEAIRAGDIGTRDAMLSAMISNFGTCEDGFQEFGIESPMKDWSGTLQSMTDNCLAIINMSETQDGY